METSTLMVCFKYRCRKQESDQLSAFTGFANLSLTAVMSVPNTALLLWYECGHNWVCGTNAMSGRKGSFQFQGVQMHPCHVQEGCPGLPPQGSSKTACDEHFFFKYLFIAYIDPYSHGFQNILTFCLVLFIKEDKIINNK